MSGPILLAVLGLIIFLLWKYSEHVKKLWPSKAPPATTAGGATPTAPAPGSADEKAGRIRLWWTIALAVIGVVVFYFGVYASAWESPNVADLGSKGRNHWLALLIVWGIGAAVIALNAKALGAAAKTLQWLLAGIILAIIVVLPARVHVSGDEKSNPQSCPPFSSTNVRECMIAEKPVVVAAGELTRAGEFEFCVVVPENSPFRIKQVRTNTMKMWSGNGDFPVQYKMIRRESLVNGKCPSRF